MTLKKTSSLIDKTYKELSIQVSLSGLSFCTIDTLEKKVEVLEHYAFNGITSLDSILVQLDYHFANSNLHATRFNKITLLHENELSNFVPKPLFNEHSLPEYLKFNIKILENDFIVFDELPNSELVNVYIPYAHVNNYIFDQFGPFEYKHFATVLVENLLQKAPTAKKPQLFVYVSSKHFEIVVLQNRNLMFYNSFEYFTKEDFIYYLLFTMEQLNLNPELAEVMLMGTINEDSELYEICYQYIKNLSFYAMPTDIVMESENPAHQTPLLLYSFS